MPHNPEECLQILDEVLAQGYPNVAEYDWGCAAGEHFGWVTVEAENDWKARQMVPGPLRARARCVGVKKFSPDQVKAFHERGL